MNAISSLLMRSLKRVFFHRWMVPWEWPERVDRHEWHALREPSGSGAMLACLHGPSHWKDAIGTVVLAHPLGRHAKGHWLRGGHAACLRRAGYNVVLFDFNGFGESECGSFDYPADVIAAGKLAARLHPDVPVGLFGASFGAGFGLCSLADVDHPFVCAFLDAPFLSLPSYWKAHRVQAWVLRLASWMAPALARRLHPELAAGRVIHSPALHLVYGAQDAVTPPAIGHRLKRALTARTDVRMTVLPAAGHVNAHRTDPQRYRACALRFLDSTFVHIAAREGFHTHEPVPAAGTG